MSASQGSGMQVGGGIAYWAHIGGFFAGMLMLTILGGQLGAGIAPGSEELSAGETST